MELAFGRELFDRYGRYAADPADIAVLLEEAVADMEARAARFAGKQRDHNPTAEHPFVVVIVDEIAFLTAYQADRKLRERTLAALATLTTQGRAVGYCVVAALQDPRKEVLSIRNLFPDTIALRLDEPSQADLVLGDGARDRGALCDQISSDPGTGGTPADPDAYDYTRAARDALHFAALFDRLVQNLRRFLGYDVQYFAAVEPQRRLAPHVHMAIRGTISRSELRQVLAATYHQVWWPPAGEVRFGDGDLPVWHEASGRYLDPATGEFLPTWDEALDAIGPDDQPLHVARFGQRFDAQGVLAGSRGASRCIGYLTKYLTKHVADCHQAQTDAQAAHGARLLDALRYEPCSPTCSNWLRYGVQPKNPHPGLCPGHCQGKAHRREHLGYAGRRVLVSRKWSGKTLADHRADRKAWLLETLGIAEPDPSRYTWEPITPGDPDHMPPAQRLLHVVADRQKWHAALTEARARASGQTSPELSATREAA